jgi:hypothetical protein
VIFLRVPYYVQQVRQLGDVDGDPPRLVAVSDAGRL